MKLKRCCFFNLLIFIFLGGSSLSLHADILTEISQKLDQGAYPNLEHIVREDSVLFEENAYDLADLKIQSGHKVMDAIEFKQDFAAMDFDHLHERLRDKDRILIGKSVAVIKNVGPEYFQASRFMVKTFLDEIMSDTVNTIVDPKKFIVDQVRDLRFKSISSRLKFSSYNFDKGQGQHLESKTAEGIAASFPLPAKPAAMTLVSSDEEDISYASFGTRIVSFYFPIQDNNTLVILYHIVTIKKEMMLFGLIWTKALVETPRIVEKSALLVLSNLRKKTAKKN